MHLRRLAVADFRSWERAELDLEPGVTVLLGPNGVGKTNLVEAAGYLATLGSHRVATDAPLIRRGAAQAVVRGQVVHHGRELSVELEITAGRANRARVNRAPVARPRDVLGILRTVLFAPEDLALVRGDPGERRRFLDDLLVSRHPRYAAVRADYERVLRQRSALLKTARSGGDLRTLDVWDGHLAQHGAALLAGRLELVARARAARGRGVRRGRAQLGADRAARTGRSLDGELPTDAGAAAGAAAGRAGPGAPAGGGARRVPGRAAPRRPGAAASGPDRPRATPATASPGRWRWRCGWRPTGCCVADDVEPVLILDDVFAELDSRRREALAAVAKRAEQVLVTAAVADGRAGRVGRRALHGEWRSSHTKSARCPVGAERVIAQGWGQSCGYCG